MTRSFTADGLWHVVRNAEARLSVWPAPYPLPSGWHAEGEPASRADCLARIEALWTDPRPMALREAMEAGQ